MANCCISHGPRVLHVLYPCPMRIHVVYFVYILQHCMAHQNMLKRLVNCFFYFYGKDESGNCKVCEIVCCAKPLQGECFLSGPTPMWFGFCIFQSYSIPGHVVCARAGVALSICWCVLDNSPKTCHISIHNINTLPFSLGIDVRRSGVPMKYAFLGRNLRKKKKEC